MKGSQFIIDRLGRDRPRVRVTKPPVHAPHKRIPLGNPFVLDKATGSKYGVWFRTYHGVWHMYRFSQFRWYNHQQYDPQGNIVYSLRLSKAHVTYCNKWYSDSYHLVKLNHPLHSPRWWKTAICYECYLEWRHLAMDKGVWGDVQVARATSKERLKYLKAVARKRQAMPPAEVPWYDQ